MKSDTAITLSNVRLALGSARFSFDGTLPGGQITAVVGPSGSGKSTLLNLVAGFEKPDTGRILIGAEDVTAWHPSQRPVSLVFQDNNLFAHLDLASNVGLGISPSLRLSASEKVAVDEALQRVGLAGFGTRLPATLSGGERQRAAFARALVRRKPVLLLDEPFAALDPDLRVMMRRELSDLQQRLQIPTIIITHDEQDVEVFGDHVFELRDGQVHQR